ncbi:MAG: hypothetical protein E6G03_13260 [Actinobacteria bacterium]|nr:MAG: hypothetical protein E6G03_13260 [Actinomycetota bacterium]
MRIPLDGCRTPHYIDPAVRCRDPRRRQTGSGAGPRRRGPRQARPGRGSAGPGRRPRPASWCRL